MVRARREFRDALTGEPRAGPGPGVAATGKFVARVKPKKGEPAVVVEVEAEGIDHARASWPILRDFRARVQEQAHEQKKRAPRATKKPKQPAATFPGAGKAADQFMRGNSEFVEVLGNLGDPIDAVRDWMDPQRVYQGGRTAKHLKKLADTPAGRGILEAFEGHKVRRGIRAALVWLFGQSRRKRWADVPWFEVDRFGDALLEGCDDSAKEWGERGKCTGWIWFPPGSGRSSSVAELSELPHDLKVAAVEAADLERLRAAVDQLEAAFKGSKCLRGDDRRLVRRRLSYLRKLEAEPARIARSAVCGPDPESGSMLCGFAAIAHEARKIRDACELGYVAAARDEDDEPDLGRSATQEEREGVPNPKPPALVLEAVPRETSIERQQREKAARKETARKLAATTVQTSLAMDLDPDARQQTMFNPSNPWGELVDLEGRVVELLVRLPSNVIERHAWNSNCPRLFWSPQRGALVFVHGGDAPAGRVADAPTGPAARTFKRWRGKQARDRARLLLPGDPLRVLGVALRIVYSSRKYPDGRLRHHDFGPGVLARAGSGGSPRLWTISGGKLRVTSRGLVG